VLDAISDGLTEEEYIDAFNMRIFDMEFGGSSTPGIPVEVASARWRLAKRTLSHAALEESARVWERVELDLSTSLNELDVWKEMTLEAFKCASTAWLSNYPGGPKEGLAAHCTCEFLDRLSKSWDLTAITTTPYQHSIGDGEQITYPGVWSKSPGPDEFGCVPVGAYLDWIISGCPRLLRSVSLSLRFY
jgi:nucleolar pre-ribosomal-associated protein 2